MVLRLSIEVSNSFAQGDTILRLIYADQTLSKRLADVVRWFGGAKYCAADRCDVSTGLCTSEITGQRSRIWRHWKILKLTLRMEAAKLSLTLALAPSLLLVRLAETSRYYAVG